MFDDEDSRSRLGSLLCAALGLLVMACGSTRHTVSPHGEELSDFVLTIGTESNGHISHSWQRATEFYLPRYEHSRIVLASRRPRDCDQEQIDCVQTCMENSLPPYLNHIKRGDGSKARFCQRECLNKYMDCLELKKSHALQFSAVDGAVDWLKIHREELLVGTVVVIAGVAFVTVTAGAGAAVLAPVILLVD